MQMPLPIKSKIRYFFFPRDDKVVIKVNECDISRLAEVQTNVGPADCSKSICEGVLPLFVCGKGKLLFFYGPISKKYRNWRDQERSSTEAPRNRLRKA
ncbi:MAG: hypothetical protein JWQ66_4456 [Mucilaginibacter sp.]|nr:hypothetical protein [Mucilaginibacter sp.]